MSARPLPSHIRQFDHHGRRWTVRFLVDSPRPWQSADAARRANYVLDCGPVPFFAEPGGEMRRLELRDGSLTAAAFAALSDRRLARLLYRAPPHGS